MKVPASLGTKDSDLSFQESKTQAFKEFDEDDSRSSMEGSQREEEDDYENMLGNSGKQTKTLEKGKNGSNSKRARPVKDPKAIVTADQQSCVNEKNCGACVIF